jgi:hypothetical protein
MDFLKNALEALPSIAQSPLAFVGYIFVVACWLIISIRVKRNKELLKNLEKLPSKSRLKALQLEMGAVKLKSGLSPEQWIKSRIHLYVFLGFAIICLMVVILFVISATTKREGSARMDITPYVERDSVGKNIDTNNEKRLSTIVKVNNGYDGSGVVGTFSQSTGKEAPGISTLTYVYDRIKDKIIIKPEMPYLSIYKSGGPITDYYFNSRFIGEFPELSVKIVNNTGNTIFVTEICVSVINSVINKEPILLVPTMGWYAIKFENEGWGTVRNPSVKFGITSPSNFNKIDFKKDSMPYTANLESFDDVEEINVVNYLPEEKIEKYSEDGEVLTYGYIIYKTENNDLRSVKFKQLMTGGMGGGGDGGKPSCFYELFLEAGKKDYKKRISVSHSLKPGEVEHFVVRVGTNKSAKFDLNFELVDVNGTFIPSEDIDLDIFVLRSSAIQQTTSKWKNYKKKTNI